MPGPLYPLQPTFARGELSPRLFSRADLDHWKMALAECVNWIILKQGGLRRRPGTEWINEVKSSADKVRIAPFIFSTKQAYLLELGDNYIRFYANGGIVNKASHTGVTFNTTTDKVLWTAHGLANDDPVIFSTTGTLPTGITAGVTYYVINKATDDFEVSATRGGAAINLTGAPSGTHSIVSPVEVITDYEIADVWKLQFSQSADILYIASPDFAPRKLTRTSASAFSFTFYEYIDGPYLGENTTPTTMTPSAVDNYHADVTITIASPGVVSWTGHGLNNGNSITLKTTGALPTGLDDETTYFIVNKSTDAFELSLTVGGASINTTGSQSGVHTARSPLTITASSVIGINDGAGFDASDVGRPISLQYSSKWYWAQITGVVSSTVVHAYVEGLVESDGDAVLVFPGTDPTGGWKLGAWSATTGWPAVVSFYQERLVWGRTDTQPQTIWMTKAGVLDNFSTTEPAQDDDAITLTILAGEVNAIQWIAEGQDLLIGTTGAMRTIGAADAGKNFSATNLVQKRQSTFGSKDIQPVQIGPVAVYASYYGISLREFLFSFQQNAYVAPELTILSEHMIRSGIQQMAYAQDKDSIIWLAMGNGELVGVTYERDQQIVAMTRHRIGGEVTGQAADEKYGIVESVACIPGADRSELWLSVKRTIDGGTKRYIERLTVPFEAMDKNDAVFVDSSYSYEGAATNSVGGAHWLKGEEVSILADGAVVPRQTVSATGGFSLANSKEAEKITFGLPYASRAKTLPIAQGVGDGTGLGRLKNITSCNIDYMETGYLEVAAPDAREPEVGVGLRGRDDPMDTSPPLKDGFLAHRFDRHWKDRGQVVLQTDKPLPATIRSITPVFNAEP